MKNKRNTRLILIMVLIIAISIISINMSLATSTGKISVETANLREAAKEDGKILDQLSQNQQVEIIEKTNGWYKVKAKGITGYIRQDLITESGSTTSNITVNNTTVNTNTNTTVNGTSTQNTSNETSNTVNTTVEETNTNSEVEEKELELGKHKIAEDAKLKLIPIINVADLEEVKKDEEVEVVEIINGWACVETQKVKGWIREDKIQKDDNVKEQTQEPEQNQEQPVEEAKQEEKTSKTLFVNTEANMREQASKSSEVVISLPVNTAVEVISESNGWSRIKVNGKEGYISSDLLSETRKEVTSRSSGIREEQQEEKVETKPGGNEVVTTAKQYMGNKYVYGGTTPNPGFDCSGFTAYVLKQYGVSLSRTAAGQAKNGVAVNKSDLKPGDLVVFGKSGINHVGIYIGNGRMIHAANASRGVTTDTINSGYYNTNYAGGRRVI